MKDQWKVEEEEEDGGKEEKRKNRKRKYVCIYIYRERGKYYSKVNRKI